MKRLTKLKDGIPVLKNGLHILRAINLLYEYEKTNISPSEIYEMKQTIINLQNRLKRMDDW